MEPKDKIMLGAEELFFKFGIKSMTMDDIARHLGMSKKTIYQFFEDKDALVTYLVNEHIKKNEKEMCVFAESSKNAIHEVFISLTHINEMFSKANPLLFHDMQKYHVTAWNSFKSFKDGCLTKIVVDNLKRGISEGLYREDINIKILAHMRVHEIEMTFNPYIFPPTQFNMLEVMQQLLKHFLLGICTLKGHRLVNKYLEITEKE
jgi:AcrR family transcriptional regulator